MSMTDPDLVGLCADTGHLYAAGTNMNADFRNYSGCITHVHLKNVHIWKLDYVKKYCLMQLLRRQ